MALDYALFQLINQFAGFHPVVDSLMVALTYFGIPVLAAIALFSCHKKTVYKTLFAAWLVFVVDFAFKLFYFRPRPFSSHAVNLLVDHLKTGSFPSRHTDLAFALAVSIFLGDRKLGFYAIIIAFFVGFSRIYVGVHYPFDVLAGGLLGVAGAFASNKILNTFWRAK